MHSGEATAAILKEEIMRGGVTRASRDIVSNCPLCFLSRSGSMAPGPFAATLHGSSPNEVLYFDYLFLGESTAADEYVFVVNGNFSKYCWLSPSSSCTAEHAAKFISRWQREFIAQQFGCQTKARISSTMCCVKYRLHTVSSTDRWWLTRHESTAL